MKKFGLKKDPTLPRRYWIDDHRFITFNPEDPASCAKADTALTYLFDNPKIETAPSEIAEKSPYAKGKAGGDGIIDQIRGVTDQLEPFFKNADREGDRVLSGDVGSLDIQGAEHAMFDLKGVDIGSVDDIMKPADSIQRKRKK